MTANDKKKCPVCSHEMFEPHYCDYCADFTVPVPAKFFDGKINISLEEIDQFIDNLKKILANPNVPYLHSHADALLIAARQKRIEYDSVLNE